VPASVPERRIATLACGVLRVGGARTETTTAEPGERVDTLAFLVGRWRVSRSIVDHRTGVSGTFEGTAALVASQIEMGDHTGVRARYDEVGELHFGDHSGSARRCFAYARGHDATVMIFFPDGRPFVELDLRSGECQSTHRCGPDLHEITTLVVSGDIVQEHWRVRGPTTDYEATTMLTRIG